MEVNVITNMRDVAGTLTKYIKVTSSQQLSIRQCAARGQYGVIRDWMATVHGIRVFDLDDSQLDINQLAFTDSFKLHIPKVTESQICKSIW